MILINNKPEDPVNQIKKEEMEDDDNDNGNESGNKNRKNDYNNNKYRLSRKLKRDEVVKKQINK